MPESSVIVGPHGGGGGWEAWLMAALVVGVAVAAALLVHAAAYLIAGYLTRHVRSVVAGSIIRRSKGPARLLLPVLAVQAVLPWLDQLPGRLVGYASQGLTLGAIGALTWLVVSLTRVADDVVAARYPMTGPDVRRARRIATLEQITRQTAGVVLVVLGVAVALMTFPQARQIGASVLASAGIAGIVVGVAAQPVLKNLLAGLQIALTEPIVLGDQIVLGGELGTVEEITPTYVVVRVWDKRRLVVPLGKFIEETFENWTRKELEMVGTVYLHVDFGVPVEPLRAEFERVVAADARWDRGTKSVAVTEAKDGRLNVRMLVSARSSGELFDLRCAVREKMVAYVQRNHPGGLMKSRVELVGRGGWDAFEGARGARGERAGEGRRDGVRVGEWRFTTEEQRGGRGTSGWRSGKGKVGSERSACRP